MLESLHALSGLPDVILPVDTVIRKWANEPQVLYKSMSAEEIYAYIKSCGVKNVTLTGGEPLIQPEIEWLITLLSADKDLRVEIETNGSVDIAGYDARPENVCMTLDYKLPDSGMEQFYAHRKLRMVKTAGCSEIRCFVDKRSGNGEEDH